MSNARAPVPLPVVFASTAGGITFERQPDGQGGEGDSLGVWRDNNRAWKIFSSRTNLDKIKAFYNTADVHGLPMGGPIFREGTVKQGTGRVTNGFALITRWLIGDEFNFHRPPKTFNSALTRQNISHSRSAEQYKRYVPIGILICLRALSFFFQSPGWMQQCQYDTPDRRPGKGRRDSWSI